MDFEAPYLLRSVGFPAGASITAVADAVTGTVEVAVQGFWSAPLRTEAHLVLRKCLAEHPAALIVDLTGLDDPWAGSAPLWCHCPVSHCPK